MPPEHARPQPPQFAESVSGSMQLPTQSIVPVEHVAEHVPTSHTSAVAHIVVQSPQCAGSTAVSKQTPAQSVVPAGHAHAPVVQS